MLVFCMSVAFFYCLSMDMRILFWTCVFIFIHISVFVNDLKTLSLP